MDRLVEITYAVLIERSKNMTKVIHVNMLDSCLARKRLALDVTKEEDDDYELDKKLMNVGDSFF